LEMQEKFEISKNWKFEKIGNLKKFEIWKFLIFEKIWFSKKFDFRKNSIFEKIRFSKKFEISKNFGTGWKIWEAGQLAWKTGEIT
jgi:hypothetical protein